jgi:hypothetical protein
VGKHTKQNNDGVIDIDGAFRGSNWQLAYQAARSFKNSDGDFAFSSGFRLSSESWLTAIRTKYIGKKFNIDQVGFVPWRGTTDITLLTGPRWFYDEGYVREFLIYFGGVLYYEDADKYTDHVALLGFNFGFRNNWGGEVTLNFGRGRDAGVKYPYYEIDVSSWFNVSPKWSGNIYGGYQKAYNFSRGYLAFYSWMGSEFSWQVMDILQLGTSANIFVNMRMYLDNVYVRSTKKIERVIAGFLFSYNVLPKSWIYFAINDIDNGLDPNGNVLLKHDKDKAGVFKIKYLYYF